MRLTRPREVIAAALAMHARAGSDFAVEDLWQEIHLSDPGLGRATLFRTVDNLVDLGILDRIEVGNGIRRYRVCRPGHHHHLICTRCHRIQEVAICLPEEQLVTASEKLGFSVERHALELYGRCADCAP